MCVDACVDMCPNVFPRYAEASGLLDKVVTARATVLGAEHIDTLRSIRMATYVVTMVDQEDNARLVEAELAFERQQYVDIP